LVISREPRVAFGPAHGAFTVTESGTPELNAALARATDVTVPGADALLIMPSDLRW